MKRITYTEVNGLLRSKVMLCVNDQLIVTVNPDTLEAVATSLHDASPKAVIKSEKDLTDLKKNIRKELVRLGVVFQNEVRPGRNLK